MKQICEAEQILFSNEARCDAFFLMEESLGSGSLLIPSYGLYGERSVLEGHFLGRMHGGIVASAKMGGSRFVRLSGS